MECLDGELKELEIKVNPKLTAREERGSKCKREINLRIKKLNTKTDNPIQFLNLLNKSITPYEDFSRLIL